MISSKQDPEFENLLIYLRESRGFNFTSYKRSTLMRRVSKRIQLLTIKNFQEYIDYLKIHPEEFNYLFNTILINVTAFFRDPLAWEYLAEQILPNLIRNKKTSDQIRIWSAGCASGEEAYTLVILMAQILGVEEFRQRVKIYATDVDQDALKQARLAMYSAKDVQAMPDEIREKYFEIVGNHYLFREDLRRSVIFGRHDLLQNAPISRLDLLVSRNTLMYFNSEAQGQILSRFYFGLNDGGYLFLGKAEMLLIHSDLFTPINLKNRIFTKVSSVNVRDRPLVVANSAYEETSKNLSRHLRLRDMGFDTAPIAQIVIDNSGTLTLVNEQARAMFALSPKDLTRPFQELELSYRPIELRSLIKRVYTEGRPLRLTNVERHLLNTERQYLDVQITPLKDIDASVLGVSITFNDVTGYIQLQESLQRSRQELETIGEELQSTNEELETTNEELQSTNEELETINEELQSTNEELVTMNEELQSSNEELQTINHELSQRTTELDYTNVFLISILRSLQTGIVVIDSNFNISIWNYMAVELWGLRTDEVLGQSIFSLDIGLSVEQLRSPIRESLSGKKPFQEMILDAINRRGRKIKCYVAITPLVGIEMQGALLMMADVEKVNSMISIQDIEERRQQQ
ncbi:MAG: CheR family methyltransferase [Nostoc sp.]|uniref:CheR family methyltransferase n=1 Tax=Nostoc sp. TaxID=1180 RepID=UPI002FF8EDE2